MLIVEELVEITASGLQAAEICASVLFLMSIRLGAASTINCASLTASGNRGVGRDAAFLDLRNRLFADLALGGKFVEALVNQIHTAVNKLLLDITEVQMTADRMPAL